jgi:Cu+-exporting ATPase
MALTGRARAAQRKMEYVCPMHPQIVRDRPGTCPICGCSWNRTMPGRKRTRIDQHDTAFWISTALTVPLVVLSMSEYLPGRPLIGCCRDSF